MKKLQAKINQPLLACMLLLLLVSCRQSTTVAVNDGSDLNSAHVGVLTGSLGEMYMEEHYPAAHLQCYDDITDAFAALKYGKLKYVFTAYTNGVNAVRSNPELSILPKQYTKEGAVVAFQKGENEVLRTQVNEVIKRYKQDGTLDSIIGHWINPPHGEYPPLMLPVNENGKELTVGISATREPMCFIMNGQISGLDSELITRIAYELGYKVKFMDMKFAALVASLSSGRVDVVISNFTATPERAKAVDFSEEYFRNPQVLINKTSSKTSQHKSFWASLRDSFNSNLVVEKRYMLIVNGLKITLIVALLSALFGTLLGGVICYLRMSHNKLCCGFAKVYIDLLRGIPHVVLLMIMFYIVFASTNFNAVVVAAIAFAMNFAAYAAEMFRTSIESINPGQNEAARAMGFSKFKAFFYIVLPQAIKRVLPVYKGELISLLKMTSIVGYIAVQDLTKAGDIIRSRTFDAFFPLIFVAFIYFFISWLLGFLLGKIKVGKKAR